MVVGRVHGSRLDADLRPVRLQVLGDEHGQRGEDPLSHLGLAHHDRHQVVRPDTDEGVRREGRSRGLGHGLAQRQVESQDQAAARGRPHFQEVTPRKGAHRAPPAAAPAARWTALRMRQ